jgi:putative Mn2+ efflux pump MntP
MNFAELLLLGVGLSMDAFAVSVCKGLATRRPSLKNMAACGLWFGGFQALMPVAGYYLIYHFKDYVTALDHWIAFALLLLIGANMIREALSGKEESANASLDFKTMLLLAIATSIDALAVGISFACLDVNLPIAVAIIGITTFILSDVGLKVGSLFGLRYKSKAEIAGGVILILLGVKIVLEHLEIISF